MKELLKKNMESNIEFDDAVWQEVSSEARDLTQRLLEKDPCSRISAKEALAHPWFTLEFAGPNSLSLAEDKVKKYCGRGYFDVEGIKPDFSAVKFCPVENLRDESSTDKSLESLKCSRKPLAKSRFDISFKKRSEEAKKKVGLV